MNKVRLPTYHLSIAPMMDWTDRHYRYFMRLITKKTLLYTEMVTTGAILRGKDRHRYLDFSPVEHPIALQLGGDDPFDLAECSKIGEDFGYDEINLNVGCPSDRVQSGAFGACLMKEPKRVADMIGSMKKASKLPITVKHRIGVNGKESFEDLVSFVQTINDAGVDRIIIHARIAILEGLSPAENRTIPPLRYDDVYQIQKLFPNLPVAINGGIVDFDSANLHLEHVNGVMIGRAAYENPYLFAKADSLFYNSNDPEYSREEVLQNLISYVQSLESSGTKLHHVMRHVLGLYHGMNGARMFRRFFSENMHRPDSSHQLISEFLKLKNS